MENIDIELHFSSKQPQKATSDFLLELYIYLLQCKKIRYIKLNFSKDVFENIDRCILDEIFLLYKFEYVSIDSMSLDSSPIEEVVVTSKIAPPYENMDTVRKLGWDKMMMFIESELDDLIVVGSYDYQHYIVISNINSSDIIQIKKLLSNNFNADLIKTMTHNKELL